MATAQYKHKKKWPNAITIEKQNSSFRVHTNRTPEDGQLGRNMYLSYNKDKKV
jgi:hypothetical protein